MELAGVPGVSLIADSFVADAISSAQDNEVPELRLVVILAKDWYLARDVSQIAEGSLVIAGKVTKGVIDALITPLSGKELEGSTGGGVIKTDEPLTFTGKTYTEAVEAMNAGFLAQHMSDGLPFVPPTIEAVEWMLSGTTRSPTEIIGVPVPPRQGTVTIEKIAVNAVMAGARPEYLPVIIAAMEVLTRQEFYAALLHMNNSASGPSPMIIVNGPIAAELDMRAGQGYLNWGNRPNNTIGRAVVLCLQNMGHTWPLLNDMSIAGKVGRFVGWCFPENEAELPTNVAAGDETVSWPSLAVELGYDSQDSVVTVTGVNLRPGEKSGGGITNPMSPMELMEQTAKQLMWFVGSGSSQPKGNSTYFIGISPTEAQALAALGYTKDELRQWIYENAWLDISDLSLTEQEKYEDKSGQVRLVNSPDLIYLFVAGGSPGYNIVWQYDHGMAGFGHQKITGATLTHAGR